jgi:uncharacterized protein YkwD
MNKTPVVVITIIVAVLMSGAAIVYFDIGLTSDKASTQTPITSPENPITPVVMVDTDDLNQNGYDIEGYICGKQFSDDGNTEVCEPRTLFGKNLLWMPDDVIVDTGRVEQLIHQKVNAYRSENGLGTLDYDSDLANIAERHAGDMAKFRYFSHVNRDNQTPTGRGESTGYDCERSDGVFIYSGIGENIAYTFAHKETITYVGTTPIPEWETDPEMIADGILELWRTSPGHNANLLEKDYLSEGLGVVVNEHGEIFSVQNFGVC